MAIKIANLEEISELYKQKEYYYKDLHLDFTKDGEFSPVLGKRIEGNDIKVDFDVAAIKNSLINLFNTKPGQRFLFPLYGLDLNAYVFEAVTQTNGQLIGEKIVRCIKTFEPRVSLKQCNVIAQPDELQYDITVIVEIPILNTSSSINMLLDTKTQTFLS